MDIIHIALIVAVVVFIVFWAAALNGKAKMKLTAESAIMRNDELKKQLEEEQKLAAKRVKTLESCETTIKELESNLDVERKLAKNRLELATTYGKKIEEVEKERDQFKALAEEGERTIQAQAKLIQESFTFCQGCGKPLAMKNWMVADGCPCNSSRGVNHGLVPTLTCTCKECDPEQTGGTRQAETLIKQIVELTENDANGEVGRGKAGRFTSKKKAS